ncbi:hypothetical protein I79_007603 [Cricetulus griseus]|uniref:Uncharacterized protein n=1 Tax=Cricetulus griseus TaxID=10029 RepID=G3HAZ1_CRIGR|nr:hypothetical protein I79_007603 [Cricetulus griseus]
MSLLSQKPRLDSGGEARYLFRHFVFVFYGVGGRTQQVTYTNGAFYFRATASALGIKF